MCTPREYKFARRIAITFVFHLRLCGLPTSICIHAITFIHFRIGRISLRTISENNVVRDHSQSEIFPFVAIQQSQLRISSL